jgi:hypothetical protein
MKIGSVNINNRQNREINGVMASIINNGAGVNEMKYQRWRKKTEMAQINWRNENQSEANREI